MASLYKTTETRLNSLLNRGFDYNGNILKKSLSSYLYMDPTRASIINSWESTLSFLVNKVKVIRTFINYTVDKDSTDIN